MLEIKCQCCDAKFSANKKQQKFIEDSAAKGMSMVMLTCKVCKDSFPFHLIDERSKAVSSHPCEFRCPTKACTGHVANIGDITDYDYGCGECGTTWRTRSDLVLSIKEAMNKFPHRRLVYKIENNDVLPIPFNEEPADYDENVKKEWNEK